MGITTQRRGRYREIGPQALVELILNRMTPHRLKGLAVVERDQEPAGTRVTAATTIDA